MLTISTLILIIAFAINYTHVLNSYLFVRIGFIIFTLTGAISFNALYLHNIGSGIGMYNGLFQITTNSQYFDIILSIIPAILFLAWPLSKNLDKGLYIDNSSLNREYVLIALLTSLGQSLLLSSSDLISLYLSIELQSFGLYILASIYKKSGNAVSAGLKYFLLGSLASCLILLGCSIVYTYTGITHFDSLYSFIFVTENTSILQGISLGFVLIFIGFFFKSGAAPLHNWSPDVYDNSPNIVTTWLTIMPKISIVIFLLDIYLNISILEYNYTSSIINYTLFENTSIMYYLKNLILISSILSLIIGSTVGLNQLRLKRLLAYSTISHLGFMLLALSINTEQSVEALIFYIVQYSLTNLNVFLILLGIGIIINSYKLNNENTSNNETSKKENDGTEMDIVYIHELKGFFFQNPILSLSLSLCFFSMAGIPPLIGFFSKQFVLYAAIQKGLYFISIVGIIVSVISATYYLNVIKILHLSESNSNLSTKVGKEWNINSMHSFIISSLTIAILIFIFKPHIILNSTQILSLTYFNY